MKEKLKAIMLIDDDEADNLYHRRIIRKAECADQVIIMNSASDALDFLRREGTDRPDLIFLDINMPGMNGWEFLTAFRDLTDAGTVDAVVIILTTSLNPDDMEKAARFTGVADFMTKPLTKEILAKVMKENFGD